MVVYAESSAVLAWLLGEPRGQAVSAVLESAERVITSDVTAVECARVLHRAVAIGALSAAQRAVLDDDLRAAAAHWEHLAVADRVTLPASGPDPVEPIRALDALHLASARLAREVWPQLTVLSLGQRMRGNAAALTLSVAPA
jgi:predicted nucleic acid-binding protein